MSYMLQPNTVFMVSPSDESTDDNFKCFLSGIFHNESINNIEKIIVSIIGKERNRRAEAVEIMLNAALKHQKKPASNIPLLCRNKILNDFKNIQHIKPKKNIIFIKQLKVG